LRKDGEAETYFLSIVLVEVGLAAALEFEIRFLIAENCSLFF
jgi:hypothetical protein